MTEIKLKRLWRGNIASIRDYIVNDAIKHGTPIKVKVEGKDGDMTLSPQRLSSKQFQINKRQIKSKFNDKFYTLIDFSWCPDQVWEGAML